MPWERARVWNWWSWQVVKEITNNIHELVQGRRGMASPVRAVVSGERAEIGVGRWGWLLT